MVFSPYCLIKFLSLGILLISVLNEFIPDSTSSVSWDIAGKMPDIKMPAERKIVNIYFAIHQIRSSLYTCRDCNAGEFSVVGFM